MEGMEQLAADHQVLMENHLTGEKRISDEFY